MYLRNISQNKPVIITANATNPSLCLLSCLELIVPKGDGIYVYFECDNLDDKVNELKEQGIEFDLEPTDQSWLWREARLRDLDGNQLVLFYAGTNRIDPPWKLQ